MAQLHQLMAGTSKKRLHCIMVDKLNKVENYRNALKVTLGSKLKHFEIVPAPTDANPWRRKTKHKWVNYDRNPMERPRSI